MVKFRTKSNKLPNNIRIINKKPITKDVYENNTMIITERTLIISRSGC